VSLGNEPTQRKKKRGSQAKKTPNCKSEDGGGTRKKKDIIGTVVQKNGRNKARGGKGNDNFCESHRLGKGEKDNTKNRGQCGNRGWEGNDTLEERVAIQKSVRMQFGPVTPGGMHCITNLFATVLMLFRKRSTQ